VWLSGIELPDDERQTLNGCLRQIDFRNEEIAILEREIAKHALDAPDVKRLMTVPGVSLMTAATFIAAVGDINRFESPRKLVGYLGLDPPRPIIGQREGQARTDLQARRQPDSRDAR
jgi:transposase